MTRAEYILSAAPTIMAGLLIVSDNIRSENQALTDCYVPGADSADLARDAIELAGEVYDQIFGK